MPRLLQLVVLLVLIGFQAIECQQDVSASKRVSYIKRLVKKIEKRINGLRNEGYVCNDTLLEVQDGMDALSDRIADLYQGTLLTELDLSRGYTKADVLCKLPNPIESCFKSYEGTPIEVRDAQFTCIQQMLWRYQIPESQRQINRDEAIIKRTSLAEELASWNELRKLQVKLNRNQSNETPDVRHGRSLLMFSSASSSSFAFSSQRSTTTGPTLRVRKEIRCLTLTERARFFDAVQALYWDGTLAAFARTHRRASRGAHRGGAFLPWHRVFITLLENELQRIDSTVTLPYWDSSLDDKMDHPTDSILWTEDFFGNGGGVVVTGPFQGFTSNTGLIEREYGNRSRLVNQRNVDRVMARCSYAAIHRRPARVEGFHNNVHRWVGGELLSLGTAPYDPVFYMHHGFIDYIWERFRWRQGNVCGRDPETDYLDDATGPHAINSPMSNLPGYIVRDGLSDYWTEEVFTYQDAPTCDNDCCGSEVLICDTAINYCVPRSRFEDLTWTTSTFAPTSTWPARRRRRQVETQGRVDKPDETIGSNVKGQADRRCDKYLDPGCYIKTIVTLAAKKRPIPSSIDAAAIDKLVPKYRGDLFLMDPEETNDNRTLRMAASEESPIRVAAMMESAGIA